MLPIRNISYLLLMRCSFWQKCKNSPKTGLGCSTPLRDCTVRNLPLFNLRFSNFLKLVFITNFVFVLFFLLLVCLFVIAFFFFFFFLFFISLLFLFLFLFCFVFVFVFGSYIFSFLFSVLFSFLFFSFFSVNVLFSLVLFCFGLVWFVCFFSFVLFCFVSFRFVLFCFCFCLFLFFFLIVTWPSLNSKGRTFLVVDSENPGSFFSVAGKPLLALVCFNTSSL